MVLVRVFRRAAKRRISPLPIPIPPCDDRGMSIAAPKNSSLSHACGVLVRLAPHRHPHRPYPRREGGGARKWAKRIPAKPLLLLGNGRGGCWKGWRRNRAYPPDSYPGGAHGMVGHAIAPAAPGDQIPWQKPGALLSLQTSGFVWVVFQ
jgi:hypothetical protein